MFGQIKYKIPTRDWGENSAGKLFAEQAWEPELGTHTCNPSALGCELGQG